MGKCGHKNEVTTKDPVDLAERMEQEGGLEQLNYGTCCHVSRVLLGEMCLSG